MYMYKNVQKFYPLHHAQSLPNVQKLIIFIITLAYKLSISTVPAMTHVQCHVYRHMYMYIDTCTCM